MPRPVGGSSVVITGATSGIGYAAAQEFARRGARLALAARDAEQLEAVRAECGRIGAAALAVPTDVADEDAVERLAAAAEREYGRIDTWVNNAGVIAYGDFEAIPSETFRRVVDTNFLGQVHGARAALRRFRRQKVGVLINLSSVWGRVTTPLASPYVVSKHAIRVLSECLRHELVDAPGIEVATILPEAVDTPIFDHAANYTGHPIRPLPPLFRPEAVAEGIVACAERPKREVVYGRTGRLLEIVSTLAPPLYCRIAPPMFARGSFTAQPSPKTDGNVATPAGGRRVRGGWRRHRRADLAKAFGGAMIGLALGIAGRPSRAKP
jgi:NAD(P)-dependent dehydrogenase (short-subunit alcohol dehydrogenase family)